MSEPGPVAGSADGPTGEPLHVERRDDGVVTLTLALPERRNAMTPELTSAWARAMASLREDRSVRCIVVTGQGRAFCAGGDLSWIGAVPDGTVDAYRDRMLPFYRTWLSILKLDVPVLAAVNGAAIGAGLCLALACDVRYASETAVFSVPFASLGMHPGMAATWLLPEAVGLPRARELFFTGRLVDAEEAEQIGLVQGLRPPDRLLPDVLEIAAGIAAQAPVAVRLTKAGLATGGHVSVEDALEYEALAQPVTFGTADFREGLAAQGDRRRPRFTGR